MIYVLETIQLIFNHVIMLAATEKQSYSVSDCSAHEHLGVSNTWLVEISIVDVMERETVCEVSCNNHTTKQTGADCSDCNLLRKYKTSFFLHFLTDLTVFLLKQKTNKKQTFLTFY